MNGRPITLADTDEIVDEAFNAEYILSQTQGKGMDLIRTVFDPTGMWHTNVRYPASKVIQKANLEIQAMVEVSYAQLQMTANNAFTVHLLNRTIMDKIMMDFDTIYMLMCRNAATDPFQAAIQLAGIAAESLQQFSPQKPLDPKINAQTCVFMLSEMAALCCTLPEPELLDPSPVGSGNAEVHSQHGVQRVSQEGLAG
jgi:hypothetical protein